MVPHIHNTTNSESKISVRFTLRLAIFELTIEESENINLKKQNKKNRGAMIRSTANIFRNLNTAELLHRSIFIGYICTTKSNSPFHSDAKLHFIIIHLLDSNIDTFFFRGLYSTPLVISKLNIPRNV